MKKNILSVLLVACLSASALWAQNIYDGLRFSTQYYDGTARGVGMGNAMLSLGGDLGALSYNPAASAVYRYSEFAITAGVNTSNSATNYLGTQSKTDFTKFNLSNIGYVGGYESSLLHISMAIASNQTNNYAFRTSATGVNGESSYLAWLAATVPAGTTPEELVMGTSSKDEYWPFWYSDADWSQVLAYNTGMMDLIERENENDPYYYVGATEKLNPNEKRNIPGSLRQSYFHERSGYAQDFVLNTAGSVDNIFFFGINVNIQSIWYNEYTSYSEEAINYDNFSIENDGVGFRDFTHEYDRTIQGTGVKIQAGFIIRPVAGLSIGGSISTPNWMFLTENWIHSMQGYTDLYGHSYVRSPLGVSDFRVTAPFKWSLGASYTFNDFMAIGVDYERVDYSSIKMAEGNGNVGSYSQDNSLIASSFKAANNVRAGLEVWPVSIFSLRLGYNYYDSTEWSYDDSRHYASAGIGLRYNNFFMDVAYQQQCNKTNSTYQIYSDYTTSDGNSFRAPYVSESYNNWKLLLTLGFRF